MKKKGYSERGLFGQINHYDAHGKKIGESRPGFLGGMNHYDNAELDYAASDTPGAFAPRVYFVKEGFTPFAKYT